MIIALVSIVIFLFILGIIVLLYNTLISKKNQVNNMFGSIDALLKKRYDLIPNLVTAVKNYMKHEKGVLTELTELRTRAISGDISDEEKIEIDSKVSRAIGGLMVAVENYPELKAGQNFLHLQASLNEVEEQISAARRAYNAAVTDYNNAVEMLPTNMMATAMGYKEKKLFEISEQERGSLDISKQFDS